MLSVFSLSTMRSRSYLVVAGSSVMVPSPSMSRTSISMGLFPASRFRKGMKRPSPAWFKKIETLSSSRFKARMSGPFLTASVVLVGSMSIRVKAPGYRPVGMRFGSWKLPLLPPEPFLNTERVLSLELLTTRSIRSSTSGLRLAPRMATGKLPVARTRGVVEKPLG